jgi:LytS/YehU family sensor histidine kinase
MGNGGRPRTHTGSSGSDRQDTRERAFRSWLKPNLTLKMQIHPHFLFNTLNSIAALLHEDIEMADRMITRLSDFLRITLQSSTASIVTLGEEVGFLQAYLDIERVRFRDRLIVELTIAPDVLDAQVPNLILQPLVENAVRHGISKQVSIGLADRRTAAR